MASSDDRILIDITARISRDKITLRFMRYYPWDDSSRSFDRCILPCLSTLLAENFIVTDKNLASDFEKDAWRSSARIIFLSASICWCTRIRIAPFASPLPGKLAHVEIFRCNRNVASRIKFSTAFPPAVENKRAGHGRRELVNNYHCHLSQVCIFGNRIFPKRPGTCDIRKIKSGRPN